MMRGIHILAMVIVLGGYIFLSFFWWPVVRRADMDVRLQIHLVAQTLRRFFTTVVLALTVQLLTGGLYLLPPAYRTFGAGQEFALVSFHKWLIIKLIAVFIILLLVPMQLFGMAFRLTRMDAGILEVDADLVARITQRMQAVSYVLVVLLTLVVVVSTQL
jgi:uncharacterized membrane protein